MFSDKQVEEGVEDDGEVREIRAAVDVAERLKTELVGQKLLKYAGEWNDVVSNKNPTLDGRGIRESQNDKGVTELHFGCFKNNRKYGWGLLVTIPEAEGEVKAKASFWDGEKDDPTKAQEVRDKEKAAREEEAARKKAEQEAEEARKLEEEAKAAQGDGDEGAGGDGMAEGQE